jgi:hypothetical protein
MRSGLISKIFQNITNNKEASLHTFKNPGMNVIIILPLSQPVHMAAVVGDPAVIQ